MKANLTIRLLSIGAIVLSSSHHMQAQHYLTAHAGYGTTNIQVSNTPVDGIINPFIKPIAQFTAGIQYESALNRQFSLVTGAQYATRGFKASEDFNVNVFGLDLPVGARVVTRLEYIEVPLVAKYTFNGNGVKPFVKAGASAGYAFNGKIIPQINALINWNLPHININLSGDLYNQFDISALAGAGINIPVHGMGEFHIDMTYRHSLNDMFQDNITNIKIKSHGVSAGVGFTMHF